MNAPAYFHKKSPAEPIYHSSLRAACMIGAFVVPLGVYFFSLTPGVGFWDTAEMQTVPYIFGIAHPPGFPAFVILGYAFSHIFAFGEVAWRLSLFSALAVAGATWFAFRTMEDAGVHPVLAWLASLSFAFGTTVWTRATRAEVHALAILFIAVAIWGAFRARATGRSFFLYSCAVSVGLAAATHPVVIWILPGVLLLLAFPQKNWSPKTAILAALAGMAPLLLYLYMPLRSWMLWKNRVDPTLALGLPAGQPFWDYGHTAILRNFILQISGAQFSGKGHALTAIFQFVKYPDFATGFASAVLSEFGVPLVVLAVIGLVGLAFANRINALALALITVCGVPFALSYVIEIDSDRYFLTAYWGIAVLAGVGAQTLLALLASRLHRASAAILSVFLAIAVGSVFYTNRDIFGQRRDRSGDQFVDRIVHDTPRDSVIGAPWLFATPLAYAAYVDRRLDRRIIESAEPKDIANRVAIWAKSRPVFLIYFETGAVPIPGVRLLPVEAKSPPLIYRVLRI